MSRYDGLIIPRSYSEYINKTDAATLLQALQLSGVMDSAPTANSNHPVKSGGVYGVVNGKKTERTALFIGDSYGASTSIANPWYEIVTSRISYKKTYRLTTGGHGFTGKDGAPSGTTGATLRWITDLTSFVNSHTATELVEITEVYIIGGFNDIYSTYENILSYMEAFFIYAKANLPNACFYVGMSGWADAVVYFTTPNTSYSGITARLRLSTIVARAYRECSRYGAIYMGDLFLTLHNYGVDFDSSKYHPSAAGAEKLAEAICNFILGKTINIGVIETPEVFIEKSSTEDEGTEKTYFWCRQKNNLIALTTKINAPPNPLNAISFTTRSVFNKGVSTLLNLTNSDKYILLKSGLYAGKDGDGSMLLYGDIATEGNNYEPCYLFINGSNILNIIPTVTIPNNTLCNVRIRANTYMAETC